MKNGRHAITGCCNAPPNRLAPAGCSLARHHRDHHSHVVLLASNVGQQHAARLARRRPPRPLHRKRRAEGGIDRLAVGRPRQQQRQLLSHIQRVGAVALRRQAGRGKRGA